MAYRELIEEKLGNRALFAPTYLNTMRVSVVAEIGLETFKTGGGVMAAQIAPNYLRKSDAEIKREEP